MKKIILRKVSVIGLTALMLFIPTFTKAEEVCITHKNYYLYSLIDEVPGFANDIYKSEGNTKKLSYSAYFPMLPDDAIEAVNNEVAVTGRICLSKDGQADGEGRLECVKGITWTLEDLYRIQNEAGKSETKTFKDENGNTINCKEYEKESDAENGNKVIEHYYGGTKWFKCGDDRCNNEISTGPGANVMNLSLETLIKGSYLPSKTEITFNPVVSSKSVVTRTINAKKDFLDYLTYDEEGNPKTDENNDLIINENSKNFVPFDLAWRTGQTTRKSILAPAVYYVEYQTCGEEYKATINYYYYKDGETTERVEFDNNEENPYLKTGLDASADYKVNSPEKKGCTIVDTKGNKYDADKVVNVLIKKNGKASDFEKNVYYDCPAEKEGEELPTGDALIYFAWAIGLGAIGYSVYYFKRLKKEEI